MNKKVLSHVKSNQRDYPVPYILSRISAGFPSPADDYIENNLSL